MRGNRLSSVLNAFGSFGFVASRAAVLAFLSTWRDRSTVSTMREQLPLV